MPLQIPNRGKFKNLPSNLSFRRSIDTSEGRLLSVVPGEEATKPVLVTEVTVRGAQGQASASYDRSGVPLTGDKLVKATSPNPQRIDRAALDPLADTLRLEFGVAFHGGGRDMDACSDPRYRAAFRDFLDAATEAALYEDLAARYLWNLLNGRALWRNGFGEAAGCAVDAEGVGELRCDWGKLRDRRAFPGLTAIQGACSHGEAKAVVDAIARALRGEALLQAMAVRIDVRLYKGAEVWPSQQFVEKTQTKRDGREISRFLASRDVGGERHGVMHAQKIGNAIRTIDEWHGEPERGAISVEAFGWVQGDLEAIRTPDRRAAHGQNVDVYRALDAIKDIAKALRDDPASARSVASYLLAMTIRGGVFGVSDKPDKPEKQ